MSDTKRPKTKESKRENERAYEFREKLVARADHIEHGTYPLWYGWAIVEAFKAGAKYQRKFSPRKATK